MTAPDKPRRWTVPAVINGRTVPVTYEEVDGKAWDRLRESQREILSLPSGGVALVRRLGT